MINPKQLRKYIVQPTLRHLDPEIPYSEDAVELLLMTAAHESNLGSYIKQVQGPALGIYQMEPLTYEDVWGNFLKYRNNIATKVITTAVEQHGGSCYNPEEIVWNLKFATAMARVHYYRAPEKLPSRHSPISMATYAKKYFNTHLGKATVEDYADAYRELVLGEGV